MYGVVVDQILADENATGQVSWALMDNRGWVQDVMDSAVTVVNYITYDSFGIYQKLIVFGLGAFFRKDGNYAYLRKFSDYEHYAFLCRHLSQPNRCSGKDEKC